MFHSQSLKSKGVEVLGSFKTKVDSYGRIKSMALAIILSCILALMIYGFGVLETVFLLGSVVFVSTRSDPESSYAFILWAFAFSSLMALEHLPLWTVFGAMIVDHWAALSSVLLLALYILVQIVSYFLSGKSYN